MSLNRTGQDAPRDGTVTFDQFDIPSCPVSGAHFSEGLFKTMPHDPRNGPRFQRSFLAARYEIENPKSLSINYL